MIQSPLGFATMGLAAALGLATATPLRTSVSTQIATLGLTTSKFDFYVANNDRSGR